ncbi:MAG: exodeoxyribonuclease VII large subunit [Thermodesulfobacteriota bacterium]
MDEPTFRPVARRIFSVAEITRLIRESLEKSFTYVWVSGEISNFRAPGSGHFYFTLKDDQAQIRAIMFKGLNRHLKFTPADGMKVICLGRLTVYEPQGVYQLVLEHMEPEGVGALALAFEQLKQKLSAEGLFDPARKRRLPFLPRLVAVVTSPTGAVVHDIIRVARRRFDTARIVVIPVKVQGESAPGEIVNALLLVNEKTDAEVIILGRGGGSLEDLSAFNSEDVARAVYASRIPVVSAVGHETDFSICDFVADLRAPTPSAAAELVFPEKDRLYMRIDELAGRTARAMEKLLQTRRQEVFALYSRLSRPERAVRMAEARLADLARRLILVAGRALSEKRSALASARVRLAAAGPRVQAEHRAARVLSLREKMGPLLRLHLLRAQGEVSSLSRRLSAVLPPAAREARLVADARRERLLRAMRARLDAESSRLASLSARLSSLNPEAVLRRGYSVTRLAGSGKVLRDATKAPAGTDVSVSLFSGGLLCRVTESTPATGEAKDEPDTE